MIDQVDREGVEAIAAQMVPKLLGATTQRDRPDLVKHVRNLIVRTRPSASRRAVTAMMERSRLDAAARENRRAGAHRSWRRRRADSAERSRGYASRDRNSQLELMPFSGHLPNLEQPAPFDAMLWHS